MFSENILKCEEITTDEDFFRLRESWQEILSFCSHPTTFCSWEWAWQWWQHLGKHDEGKFSLLILTATDSNGTLMGLAPFCYQTQTRATRWFSPLRALRPLGTRLRCQMEDMTEEPILLLREGFEDQVLQAILSHLINRRPMAWDLTHVRAMREHQAPTFSDLWKRCSTKWSCSHQRSEVGQIIPLPDSWDKFRSTLSRSMRGNLAYYPRLLLRDGHRWEIRVARTPGEVAAATDVLIDLHHRRSQSTRGVGHRNHIPGEKFESFLRDVLGALSLQGLAHIILMEVDGVPIAAQAILEQGSMLTFYYSGYDPAWYSYSPITILNARAIEEAIGRGLQYVNYLPGTARWKQRWGTSGHFVMDEISWIQLRPRPIFASLLRVLKRRLGKSCQCGFCGASPSVTEDKSLGVRARRNFERRVEHTSSP